ncbi:thioester domain-containing protein [Microbacterium sp. zg.B48]|uniref:thioester domain-containing protein n=1 Tax=Microbacterium sp. zg.B48 TaxID=2969408 RepID=UPI00214CA823|nr:thioester domain-containing protein [Microbacterium sp. zg.B48]MCR2763362.1 thioester domain-containing protein [Microbacterium sp. zg.B48]
MAALTFAFLPVGGPAQARLTDESPVIESPDGPNTDIEVTGLGPGARLTGGYPATPTPQDPMAPYPAAPPAGYTLGGGFTALINTVSVTDPTLTAEMYCIDVRTGTLIGGGYENGTWDESNVQNLGYVAYILNNFYPAFPAEPAGLASEGEQAAAVQSAIWYFTDGFILDAASPIRAATAGIIAAAQLNGPVTEPPPPAVSITPPAAAAPAGSAAGPFTVTTDAPSVTLSVPDGYTMYGDAAATAPLPNPYTTTTGAQVWVGSGTDAVDETLLSARAVVTVQRGRVYLYDGLAPGVDDLQKLVLAETATLEATAQAPVQFFEAASLTVNKAFAGAGVGQQGASQLTVDCGDGVARVADIPQGASTAQVFTFEGIAVGATCLINEPATGETTAVTVTTDAPQSVPIPEAGATATITNTVTVRPGALDVTKVIAGPQAGLQGEITLDVVCGTALSETVVIPAGAAAGTYTETFSELPAGTECTITETATGETAAVAVVSDGPVTVTVAPGAGVAAAVTDTVTYRPGSLSVSKVLTGALAGQQGQITLAVDCGAALADTVIIPAGAAAGTYTETFTELPAGTACTVTEPVSGETSAVRVFSSGTANATIQPGTDSTVELTNTVTQRATLSARLPATGSEILMPLLWVGGGGAAAGALLLMGAVSRRRSATSARD